MSARPLMSAVAAQQAVLDDVRRTQAVQAQQIALIASLAGISPQISEIAKTADINNPAQPIPDPGEQGPSETTEQAATPETNDDVRAPGQTGNSAQGVPAASTDTALTPGGTLPAEPYGNLVDVTAPVSGTNTGEVGGDQTRIESDVRMGNPMVPDVAFPWTISPNESNNNPPASGEMSQGKSAARIMASLRLAKLRIQAGLATGDDLIVATSISTSGITDAAMDHEIGVLSQLTERRTASVSAPTGAPRRSKERTAPRLAPTQTGLASTAGAVSSDDSDLFLSDGDFVGL